MPAYKKYDAYGVKMIDANLKGLWWWGYKHKNGSAQLKRWFGDHEDYTGDCVDNPNVIQIVIPFESATREGALKILQSQLF